MVAKPVPRKVLLAITSYSEKFYDDGAKTGLFWSEAAHPLRFFEEVGFEVDIVSETGKFGVDEHSISDQFLSTEELEQYKDKNSPINQKFKQIKRASDVNADDYGIFFAAGGHGTVFDFPKATSLLELASQIYANGGIVAAVCHGPVIFENLKDKETGEFLGKGKTLTGFTNLGEEQMGVQHILNRDNLKTCEQIFNEIGATYSPPPAPFDVYSVIDGRIVTGPNPASAYDTANGALKVFNSLEA